MLTIPLNKRIIYLPDKLIGGTHRRLFFIKNFFENENDLDNYIVGRDSRRDIE